MGQAAVPDVDKHEWMRGGTELVQRCQAGEAEAFEELVRKYERRVFGLIYQILHSATDVEDVAQEVFTKLYFSLPQFRLEASFDAWLYRIVVNSCYDHLRRLKRNPQVPTADLCGDDLEFFDRLGSVTQPKQLDFGRRLEIQQVADELLSQLPPKERTLLVLKEVEEFSIDELAEIFKASKSAIKLRLFRARKQLKAAYDKSKKKSTRVSYETS